MMKRLAAFFQWTPGDVGMMVMYEPRATREARLRKKLAREERLKQKEEGKHEQNTKRQVADQEDHDSSR